MPAAMCRALLALAFEKARGELVGVDRDSGFGDAPGESAEHFLARGPWQAPEDQARRGDALPRRRSLAAHQHSGTIRPRSPSRRR